MYLAAVFRGVAIIASDQNHGLQAPTGEVMRYARGGRLARLGDGWIALGGNGTIVGLSIEALTAGHVNATDLAAVAECLQRTAATAPAVHAERWPVLPFLASDVEEALFIVAGLGNVAQVNAAGRVAGNLTTHGAIVSKYAQYEGDKVDTPRAVPALSNAIRAAGNIAGAVRAVAAEFARVALLSDAMTPTIEMGVGPLYLTGEASELAQLTDAQIAAALRPPPPYDASILSQTTNEAVAVTMATRSAALEFDSTGETLLFDPTTQRFIPKQIIGGGSTCTLSNRDAFWGSGTAYGTATGGMVTLGRTGAGTGTAGRQITVTFPTAYSTAPYVVITPKHSGSVGNAYTAHLGIVTASSFDVYLAAAPITSGDDSLHFYWLVVG